MNKLYTYSLLIGMFLTVSNITIAETYKIACLKDYHPYSSVNKDNELKGIIIDWWNLWAQETGNKIVFIPTNIEGCLEKTLSGEVDIIAGIFFSKKRASQFSFADNILRMRTVLYVNQNLKIDSLNQLKTTVGVVENDLAHIFFNENHPEIQLEVYDSFSALRYAAKQNDIEAFIYDVPNPIGNYKSIPAPDGYRELTTLYTNNLRPAVKKDNLEMLNLIIDGYGQISNEKIIQTASQWKIFSPEPTNNRRNTILIIALVVIIVTIMTIRIRKQKLEISRYKSNTDVQDIIDKGENDSIEFKSSLRWDYRQEKTNKTLEHVIIKTISAFLNTEGGTLLIGVDDEGTILGLENDYNTFSKKNADGFMLTLTNLVNQNLGKGTHKYISINILSVNEKDVCIINMQKSDKPVFIGKNDKEEFFIRASASSQPLGMKETYEYINSHWK